MAFPLPLPYWAKTHCQSYASNRNTYKKEKCARCPPLVCIDRAGCRGMRGSQQQHQSNSLCPGSRTLVSSHPISSTSFSWRSSFANIPGLGASWRPLTIITAFFLSTLAELQPMSASTSSVDLCFTYVYPGARGRATWGVAEVARGEVILTLPVLIWKSLRVDCELFYTCKKANSVSWKVTLDIQTIHLQRIHPLPSSCLGVPRRIVLLDEPASSWTFLWASP